MSRTRPSSTPSLARLVWGVIAGLLLLALLATVFLGRGSTEGAEAEAEDRAANWANTVLFDVLAPEQVEGPILGPDYRELLITVQAGILSDDRAARVRIWNADSLLVFSTDQRDKIDEFIASDNPQIETALGGQTASVPTQATVAPRSGLAGTDEKLFQTFVPLRLENQLGVSGVVQIDQRYAAIEADAADVWQTARLALVIALTVAVAAFLFTLRARPEPVAVPTEAVPVPARQQRKALERAARAEGELQALRARVEQAEAALAAAEGTSNEAVVRARELEERATRAEERAANAEIALQEAARAMTGGEAPRRGVPGVGAVSVAPPDGELAAKVEDLERARDELIGEVGRLRAALGEREAELALARESAAGDGELEEVRGLAARHEARAADLEQQLAAMSGRATDAEERAADLEQQLAAMSGRATDAGERVVDLQARLRDAETAAEAQAESAATELEAAHARTVKELEAARTELAKADVELAAAREELAARVGDPDVARAAEERATAVEARLGEMEGLIAGVGERATQAERELAQANERAEAADAKLAELEASRAELAKELETVRADAAKELETVRADAAKELETVRADAAAATEAAGEAGDIADLRSQIAALEDARRTDIAELQRAQEALANTQFEATAARRRLKELEDRLAEIEAQPSEPQYMPQPELETSFAARFAHLMREHEAPAAEPSADRESPPEEEVLSLRERLARAAAARHRAPGAPGPDG